MKLKPASEVTAMVVDTGIFVEMARTLGKTYKKVYYCCPSWVTPFPRMNQGLIGHGFDEIEVVLSPFEYFEEIDLFVFPDVGFGPMQVYLESVGKAVWGSRMGEELEMYRDDCKKLQKKLGMPVSPYVALQGTEALREYLKTHDDQFVKISFWRGHFETFHTKNYQQVEPKLTEIEHQLGALKTLMEFIVEEALNDKVEGGTDAYCVDGELPSLILCGREMKDCSYVGRMVKYKDVPESITRFDTLMKPVLKEYGYKGFYSTEIRVGKDKVPYMIDFCARAGSPPNELYQVMFKNIADIVWLGANGALVDPEPIAEWGAEILIHSAWAVDNWQPIEFDPKYADFIKLRNAIKIDGNLYTMPQTGGELPEIAAIVGYGDTMDAAMDMARKVAATVEGFYLDIQTDSLDKAENEIEKAREFGVFPK